MRLTLDWDNITRDDFCSRLILINDAFPLHALEAFKTKKGYHLIVHGVDATFIEMIQLRKAFWDDPLRIKFDQLKENTQPRQVLWTEKNGYRPIQILGGG